MGVAKQVWGVRGKKAVVTQQGGRDGISLLLPDLVRNAPCEVCSWLHVYQSSQAGEQQGCFFSLFSPR